MAVAGSVAAPSALHRALLRWYRAHGRPLPWRRTSDPYRILVSEMMLQQTQVARVREKLPEWFRAFPTVRALAMASRREVLLAWSGLGYNRRSLHLHAAAKALLETNDGRVPADLQQLLALPGIGRYSAHAVLCFAFRLRVPVVDVNIRRVFSRVLLRRARHDDMLSEQEAWDVAETLLPPRAYHDWNQALMDIGALFCTARAPRCEACPLRRHCASAHRIEAPASTKRTEASVIPRRIHRGRVLALLGTLPKHRASARAIAQALDALGTPVPADAMPAVLETLRKDGMISLSRGGKPFGLPLAGIDVRHIVVTLAE
jgi:A/G-specific adenine glycosylase